MWQLLYPIPVYRGPGLVDELVKQRPEPVELLLQLLPLTLRGRQQEFLQLHGEALLGVLLGQLLPLHAGRPLVTKNLQNQFVSFFLFQKFPTKWP